MVKEDGAKKVFRKIKTILSEIPVEKRLALKDISVVQSDDPLIVSLRKIKVRGISGVSLTTSAISDQFIADAFIYWST